MATGILGAFLGILNLVETFYIGSTIQVQKIHTGQIWQLEVGLTQLNDIFQLYLKNNPSLLYAKLEDVQQSLANRLGNLKDTMQML
jgi:hypothetical protein